MIIYISLGGDAFEAGRYAIAERLLHEIVDIYIKGRHLLVLERETIEAMRASLEIGRHADVVLSELYASYSQMKGIVKTSPVSLQVLDLDSDLRSDGTIFKVGAKKFIEYDLSKEAKLLLEHKLHDGEFLSNALQRLATRGRLGRLNFEIGHGGGDDMPAMFKADVESHRITVCVADSDKTFPGAPTSDKCSKLRKIQTKFSGGIHHFVELPCHEAENMLPLSSISQLDLSHGHVETIKLLGEIESQEVLGNVPSQERLKLFFDFKNGIAAEEPTSARRKQQLKFLKEKFDLINVDISRCEVAGLGDHLTKRVAQNGKAISDFSQAMFTCPYWRDVFMESLSLVLYFLLGTQKRVAM